MPDLGRTPVERVPHLAAQDEAAAEAGAAGEICQTVSAGVGAPAVLGQRARRRVVMQPDGVAGGVGDAVA